MYNGTPHTYIVSLLLSALGLCASLLAVWLSNSIVVIAECLRSGVEFLGLLLSILMVQHYGGDKQIIASRFVAAGMLLSAGIALWLADTRWQAPTDASGFGLYINLVSATISAAVNAWHSCSPCLARQDS